MSKKEPAVKLPIELDGSEKVVKTLEDVQKLVNDLNKSLRITANVLKDLGGSHSVALASALSPSRDMKGTNAAVKGFVQGTDALTDLQRAQNRGMNISAKAALAQTQSTAAARKALNEDILARYGTLNQSAVAKAKAENIRTVAKARADAIHKTGAAKLHEQGLRDTAKGLKDIDYTEELVDREEKRQAKHTEGFKNRVNFQTEAQRLRRKEKAEEKEEAERKKAAERAEKEAKAKVDRGDRAAAALAQKAKFADIGVKATANKEAAKQGTEAAKLANKLALQGGTTKELIELRASLRSSRASGGGAARKRGFTALDGRKVSADGAYYEDVGMPNFLGALPGGSAAMSAGRMAGGGSIFRGNSGDRVAVAAATAYGARQVLSYGLGKPQQAMGDALGSQIALQEAFQPTAQMGGMHHVQASLKQAGGAHLRSAFGMSNEEIAGSASSFLASRGQSGTSTDLAKFLSSGKRFGMDPALGGIASSQGYSGGDYDEMLRNAQRGGLAGSAMHSAVQGQLGAEDRARRYGIQDSPIALRNSQYSLDLARQGMGSKQYGGTHAAGMLQTAGQGPADAIRSSFRSIADSLVLVDAVKKGGSLQAGLDVEAGMDARARHQAILQGQGAAPIGMQGLGFSSVQAQGRGRRFLSSVPGVEDYNVANKRAEVLQQNAALEAGQSSGMLDAVQSLTLAIKALDVRMVTTIPEFKAAVELGARANENVPSVLGWMLKGLQ